MKAYICSFVLRGGAVAGVELVIAKNEGDALDTLGRVLVGRGYEIDAPELWWVVEP